MRWCKVGGWSGQLYIFGESLEAGPVALQDGYGDVAGLAGVDVFDDSGFAGMGAGDDFTLGTIFEFLVSASWHERDDSTG